MTGPVEERGELTIEFEGKEYMLRPSLEALRAVERDLTKLAATDNPNFAPGAAVTIQNIMQRLWPKPGDRAAGLRIEEYGIIIYHALIAGAKQQGDQTLMQSRLEKVTEMVFEKGQLDCLEAVTQLVTNWLSGGTKKKPDPETPTQ